MARLHRALAVLAIVGTLTTLGARSAHAMPAGPELLVNTFTAGFQFDPAIAIDDDGDFAVVWTSINQDGSSNGVYLQRFDALGAPQGGEVRVNTHTADSQTAPAAAMDADGELVVVWQSAGQDGSLWGVYAQRFDADGARRGDELRVNTYTTREQVTPAVAMDDDGDFVVAWASFGQDGSGYGVFARRFDANGIAASPEFRVNTYTNADQNQPSVTMDADGDFVVAWQSFTQGPDLGSNTYFQRYDANGVAQGAVVRANTFTTSDQGFPSVAADADGDFMVVWRSVSQDGSLAGVYGQRYAADGTPDGAEVHVSTHSLKDQTLPSVSMDDGGETVVVWASDGQDGSNYGVFGQRFSADGAPSGAEFRVNTFTTGDQTSPAVAVDADGDFVVAWHSANQDGSAFGVYAQRFLLATPEVCDGLDNDRDGTIDDGVMTTFFVDADGDGHGDPSSAAEACIAPSSAVLVGEDADDADATVYPGAPELDDGKDNDQDGEVDDGLDADGDGYTPVFGGDFDDADVTSYPGAPELDDGRDNDGDAAIDEGLDADGDGYTPVFGRDADDADPTVYPGAPELCDGKDNDQDGAADEGWVDSDGDGAMNCVDEDDDGDGIPDARDPDVVAALITALPASSIVNKGAVSATTARLDAVESAIASGSTSTSIKQLEAIRMWVDGCSGTANEKPDNNDKVVFCSDQRAIRAALDQLIANLAAT